jgi:hypothetical protein
VVEDALRRTLAGRGEKATGNLESMNQVAMDTGLYSRSSRSRTAGWWGQRRRSRTWGEAAGDVRGRVQGSDRRPTGAYRVAGFGLHGAADGEL